LEEAIGLSRDRQILEVNSSKVSPGEKRSPN
jgi:hypothetical protein